MDHADAINHRLDEISRGMDVLTLRINHLAARQVAMEGVFVHLLSPVLIKVAPEIALKVVAELRTLRFSFPGAGDGDPLVLLAEEYAQRLADSFEAPVRANLNIDRRKGGGENLHDPR